MELKPLDKKSLIAILSVKKHNLVEQTCRLMATEGVTLEFTADGIDEMAGFAEVRPCFDESTNGKQGGKAGSEPL